jgi:hypothetical protein
MLKSSVEAYSVGAFGKIVFALWGKAGRMGAFSPSRPLFQELFLKPAEFRERLSILKLKIKFYVDSFCRLWYGEALVLNHSFGGNDEKDSVSLYDGTALWIWSLCWRCK